MFWSDDWLQHALRRTPWRTQRQAVGLAAVGLAVAIVIGALFLAQSTTAATTGRQLEDLIAQRNRLEQTNEQLRTEIAGLQSVPRLLARAQVLGFRPAERNEIEYLVVDGYNPNRSETVAPLEVQQEDLPVYEESFTGWVRQQWDALRQQFRNFSNREGR